jgi:Trypsin-like peptidase domain
MTIPNDPLGRCWLEGEFVDAETRDQCHSMLLSLMAWGPGRVPQAIGTGFIIATFGRQALAVSAAHNLVHATRIQRPWSLSHHTALAEFTIDQTNCLSVDPTALRAVYRSGDGVDACIIGEVNFVPELDVALITVQLQTDNVREFPRERMFLDTSVPMPGREVFALGCADMAVQGHEARIDGFARWGLERRVTLRRGIVTNVYPQGARVPWPCFETSIPVEAGMSGGPICWLPRGSEPAVCGMISQDFSPDEARTSYCVAGCSTAAMLWPALGLAVHGSIGLNAAPKRIFLLELIQQGAVKDIGGAAVGATVVTEPDGKVTISRTI